MSNVAHIIERYETTIQTLTEQVQTQQQQIHELKSLLLYTMEQQQQLKREDTNGDTPPVEVLRVVPTGKAGTRVTALEVDPNSDDDIKTDKKLYVYNSEEHELHWKSLVDGMVREALYTHLTRLDEQLACSMADRLRRVTREHVVSSVDKEFRRLRREAALEQGHTTIEGISDAAAGNRHHEEHNNSHPVQNPTSRPYQHANTNGINISRHSHPQQDDSRRASSIADQQPHTSSLMNQSRTLVDDIRRLKSMLGGSSHNTSTASANFNNSTDEVGHAVDIRDSVGRVQGKSSASELTQRLLSKLKSKERLTEMYSQQDNIADTTAVSQLTPADTTDPHHRPKSAKRRHRGDDNISPVTSPQQNMGSSSRVDPNHLGGDCRQQSSTVFYRKPQSDQQHHSQSRSGKVHTGMEWSHLEDEGRPSAMVDMSRHNHRY
eukprot:GFYU01013764.1.p1 GENE.GFYU01013764.1~~GFYU01013764.1.p1  ORF type:complete len:434 (+),score=-6.00 GFYU01013764.1:63-1364(+)